LSQSCEHATNSAAAIIHLPLEGIGPIGDYHGWKSGVVQRSS
jgi:hypothetical protein